MYGLKIVSSKKFYDLFNIIFDDVKGYRWIFDHNSFYITEELEDQSKYDYENDTYVSGPVIQFVKDIQPISPEQNDWHCSNTDILTKYGKGTNEDWNSIFGTADKSFNQKEWGNELLERQKQK